MAPPSALRRARAPKRPRYSARAFWLSVLLISSLAAFALIADKYGIRSRTDRYGPLRRRGVGVSEENQECRLVHQAKDKCAFVQANCPDEEAGLFSYLTLYYCRLPHVKPIAFTILVLWLGLLFSTIGIAASDFFCINLSTIANILGMSESMAGVTFLAFGNGSPDVFSTFAAMSTHSGSLAVGELIGAAGFITAVVAGSMALVRPFKVARKSFVRDVCFFIAAASFSMVFLYDGKLYLWECVAMVCFYIFYVCTVVLWHWWLGQRRRRNQKNAAARGHFVTPGSEEAEVDEQYHDDEDGAASSRPAYPRDASVDDFSTLERGGIPTIVGMDEDEEAKVQGEWLSAFNSNMRLSRPRPGSRRNTLTPIRPSLVGALEFQAVLSGLQRSRNIQSTPINLRRYSDDAVLVAAQDEDGLSTVSDPAAARAPYNVNVEGDNLFLTPTRPALDHRTASRHRPRAVSMNDTDRLRTAPTTLKYDAVPNIDLLGPLPEDDAGQSPPVDVRGGARDPNIAISPSPSLTLSSPPSSLGSGAASPAPFRERAQSPELLAPPGHSFFGASTAKRSLLSPHSTPLSSAQVSPKMQPRVYPRISIPDNRRTVSSDSTYFPSYNDYPTSATSTSRPPSLLLPPPSVSPEAYYRPDDVADVEEQKPLKWWPYKVLPSPRALFATLFPTLYTWRDKNIWEKLLGVVAAPSVFLLTITLPVVETEKRDEDASPPERDFSLPPPTPGATEGTPPQKSRITIIEPETHRADHNMGSAYKGLAGHGSTAGVAASAEEVHERAYHAQPATFLTPTEPHVPHSPELPTSPDAPAPPKDWNRWLTLLQAFTAPYLIVLVVWANTSGHAHALLKLTLYSLVASLVLLAVLLTSTTPARPPRWRPLLCFLGFGVSIAWISSIASEVVGVLKTLGVILDISDAILGLTIFAVGNSLGDLVADITVARLGFPVMALSACFGGPMLNILLGIGLSGSYMAIVKAEDRQHRHPGDGMRFKPYHIDVSSTLVISGATLLVTLVGLLVAVPARGWKMDRWIGWGLVGLWAVSTVGNVVVEVCGWGGEVFGA